MTTVLNDTASDDHLAAEIAESIERHGFAVRHVRGGATRPSWSYTIGLDRLDHPELVVLGVTADAGAAVIHWLVDLVRGGERPTAGREVPYAFRGVPIRLVPVPRQCSEAASDLLGGHHARRSTGAAGPLLAALQVVWADRDGHFPWEAAFDAELAVVQPLLEHRWTKWCQR